MSELRRIKLIVSYDGTNYCGWQKQPNGITIEEVLNKVLSSLCGEEIEVIGASRTDSGVHAFGNVAVFDTRMKMEAAKFAFALNQRLPEDIRIQESEEADLTWHPRKCDCVKTYIYRILNRKINIPTERLYAHFCYFRLDIDKMREASGYFIGTHDFTSFCSQKTQAQSPVRTIHSLEVLKDEEMITIVVSGDGFLYNMIRIIAGTLIKVGTGVYPPDYVKQIFKAKNRRMAGQTMPARGLTLVEIEYL
jgi:tRNA pseudouridine synthase A